MEMARELMVNDLLEKDLIRGDEIERFRSLSKPELLARRAESEEIDEAYCHRILNPIFEHNDTPFINCRLESVNGKTHLHFTLYARVPIARRNKYEDTLINPSHKRALEIMSTSYKITVNFVNEDIPMLTADVGTDAHRESKEALNRSGADLCIIEFKDTNGLPNFLKTLPPKLKVWFIAHSEFFRTIPQESWSQVRSFVAKNTLTRQAWQYLTRLRVIENITVKTFMLLTERDLLTITSQWRGNQRNITLWTIHTENANYNHVEKAEYERYSNYNGLFHSEVLTVAPCHQSGGLIFSATRKIVRDESRSPSVEPEAN